VLDSSIAYRRRGDYFCRYARAAGDYSSVGEGVEAGHTLVIATREKFVVRCFQKMTSRLFTKSFNRVGKVQFPENGSDVLLLDKTVLNDFRRFREKNSLHCGAYYVVGLSIQGAHL